MLPFANIIYMQIYAKLEACLRDIKLGHEHLRDQLSGDVVSVDGIALASNTTVKNLCSL